MGGVRLGGRVIIVSCSPPFTNSDISATDSVQVYRACTGDAVGNATQITTFTDGRTVQEEATNPILSPNGSKILFEVLSNSNDWEIWVTNSTPGSTATQLVAALDEHYYHPSWGADSNTFVYVQGTENRLGGPFTIFKDTVSSPGSPTTIVSLASGIGRYLARPRFNFDGTRIAYMQFNGTNAQLRCCDADGSNDNNVQTLASGYDFNDPPSFGWANSSNLIAWQDGSTGLYIGTDTGTGIIQLNDGGDSAGIGANVSHSPFIADDSAVIYSAIQEATRCGVFRADVSGTPNPTDINLLHGPTNSTYMRAPIVYNGRVWFVEFVSGGDQGVASMLPDGSGYQLHLDVSLGTPDLADFSTGWGWYFN